MDDGAMRHVIYTVVVCAIGLCLGSFYNVVIYRMPRRMSLWSPSSRCPHCRQTLQFLDVLPVLGWFLVGGRCRYCRKRISFRYPLVELATGLMFGFVAWRVLDYGWDTASTLIVLAMNLLFVSILVVAAGIDSDTGLLPDRFTIGGVLLGLAAPLLLPIREPDVPQQILQALAGMGIGLAVGLLFHIGGTMVLKAAVLKAKAKNVTIQSAFGWGDIKMLAACGAYLGYRNVYVVVLVASVSAVLLGWLIVGKRTVLPFGPFAALGAWAALSFNWSWVGW